jgi:hypothetical protein
MPLLLHIPTRQCVLEAITLRSQHAHIQLKFLRDKPRLWNPRFAHEPMLTIDPEASEHQRSISKPSLNRQVGKGISPDGLFPKEGVENTLKMLRAFNPDIAKAQIRLDETYTNRFVEQALRTVKH